MPQDSGRPSHCAQKPSRRWYAPTSEPLLGVSKPCLHSSLQHNTQSMGQPRMLHLRMRYEGAVEMQ